MTLTEKILFNHLAEPCDNIVRGETYLNLRPDRVIMQDATAQMTMLQFMKCGLNKSAVPASIHCDHLIPFERGMGFDTNQALKDNAEVYEFLKSAADKYGIDFWKPGAGVIHQVAFENYVTPGMLMVGTDSHTPTGGGLCAVCVGVGGADAVDVLAGQPWELKMPKIINIRLEGKPAKYVSAKDIVISVVGKLGTKGATGCALEYSGEGCKYLSATDKATICNMGAECGATFSIFPIDKSMIDYLKQTNRTSQAKDAVMNVESLSADEGAVYDDEYVVDLSILSPYITGPYSPDAVCSVFSTSRLWAQIPRKISSILIGSCTNSSLADIATCADIAHWALEHDIHSETELIICPGSKAVFRAAQRCGYIDTLVKFGATIAESACGPCIGQWNRQQHAGPNTIITTFNRNFKARNDGNPETYAFICSPITAMRYACTGTLEKLIDPDIQEYKAQDLLFEPGDVINPTGKSDIVIAADSERLMELPDWPCWDGRDLHLQILRKVSGKCTTDDISPAGKWLRYRGHLANISKNFLLGKNEPGRITPHDEAMLLKENSKEMCIVGDWNYGEGSSREHAALEARWCGVRAVIAKSFARIHETNLKKQGILALTFEDEHLYDLIDEDSIIDVFVSLRDGNRIPIQTTRQGEHPIKGWVLCSNSEKQWKWFEQGSAMNVLKAEQNTLSIPYIEGDGIGPEVVTVARAVVDNLLKVNWIPISHNDYDVIKKEGVALKGPLGTPVGTGHRSYNVMMRQSLDLFACIRPIRWYGNRSPVSNPQYCDMIVFRENTEDLYAGIEFDAGTQRAKDLCEIYGVKTDSNHTSVGLKIISENGSKRLMRMACEYAKAHPEYHNHITIVHKGNIMKYTEGNFRKWCYDVAQEYPELKVDDCICDAFLQNSLLHPMKYDIIVTTNLNGDYISDALAAQVGGVGISPGVNMNNECAVFEATHGTAPDIAGKGLANPCSCVLSAAMMLEYLGYANEADRIRQAVRKAIHLNPNTTEEYKKNIIYYLNND